MALRFILMIYLLTLTMARPIQILKKFTGDPLPAVEITCNGWKVRKSYRVIGTTG